MTISTRRVASHFAVYNKCTLLCIFQCCCSSFTNVHLAEHNFSLHARDGTRGSVPVIISTVWIDQFHQGLRQMQPVRQPMIKQQFFTTQMWAPNHRIVKVTSWSLSLHDSWWNWSSENLFGLCMVIKASIVSLWQTGTIIIILQVLKGLSRRQKVCSFVNTKMIAQGLCGGVTFWFSADDHRYVQSYALEGGQLL